MYPLVTQELVRQRIAELYSRAQRERQAHALARERPRALQTITHLIAAIKGAV